MKKRKSEKGEKKKKQGKKKNEKKTKQQCVKVQCRMFMFDINEHSAKRQANQA